MHVPSIHELTRALRPAVAVGVVYFLAAKLAWALRTEAETPAFWPAAGIGIGASIVLGRNARLAIAAAIAIAHVSSCLAIGRSPWLAIALGAINAGQALLAADLIDRWFDRPFVFHDVRHVLGLVAAAGLGAAFCGVAGAAVMTLLETTAPSWLARSVSGAVGIVVVAPPLIALAQLWRERPSKGEWIEGLARISQCAV